jgi:hypothetical protein
LGDRFQGREVLYRAKVAWFTLKMGPEELHLLIELAGGHCFSHCSCELNGQDIIRNQTLGVRSASLALMGHVRDLVGDQGPPGRGVWGVTTATE